MSKRRISDMCGKGHINIVQKAIAEVLVAFLKKRKPKHPPRGPLPWIGPVVILVAIIGCQSPGRDMQLGAGQLNQASWDAEGNLMIMGDGTSAWNVEATGEGWSLKMSSDPKIAAGGVVSMAADNNVTLRSAFDLVGLLVPVPAVEPD